MSKKFGTLSKKRILIIAIAGLVTIGLAVGCVYYFKAQHERQVAQVAEQKKVIATERIKLDETAFKGDRELASKYLERVQAGESDEAYGVYEQAIANAADAGAKAAFIEQAIAAASIAKQTDHLIRYSVLRTEIDDSHRASANAADVYASNNDPVNQKKYLQQAIGRLEQLPKDSEEYVQFKASYQETLAKIGDK